MNISPHVTRHQSALVGFLCALCVLCGKSSSAPSVREEAPGYAVEASHFRAAFDLAKGGLLEKLTDKDGRTLAGSCRTYSDYGFDVGRRAVSSGCEKSPKVRVERSTASVSVVCEGNLVRDDGQPAQAGPIRYEARYEFDDSSRVKITLAVAFGFDQPDAAGFLAHMMPLGEHVEWFVNTADGRICQRAGAVNQRTWQSVLEPISQDKPWLGVLLRTGQVLRVSGLKTNAPLQNVFFHDSGKGPTTLFFAWLDGNVPRPVRKDDRWEASFVLDVLPLSELRE